MREIKYRLNSGDPTRPWDDSGYKFASLGDAIAVALERRRRLDQALPAVRDDRAVYACIECGLVRGHTAGCSWAMNDLDVTDAESPDIIEAEYVVTEVVPFDEADFRKAQRRLGPSRGGKE